MILAAVIPLAPYSNEERVIYDEITYALRWSESFCADRSRVLEAVEGDQP
jgi:hypothetical protein